MEELFGQGDKEKARKMTVGSIPVVALPVLLVCVRRDGLHINSSLVQQQNGRSTCRRAFELGQLFFF